ncbi:hypothetical protein PPNSA23_04520 [Phyllobacterium phragmitis]|uniref:Uncharacterized protein n=1 Tax=Phyllobacterium phragmitis TaxID=2670329 RepID=A0ABQ0GV05_9HYPH
MKSVGEGADHRLLADEIAEILRTILSGENAIGAVCRFRLHAERVLILVAHLCHGVWTAGHGTVNLTSRRNPAKNPATANHARERERWEAGTVTRARLVRAASFRT